MKGTSSLLTGIGVAVGVLCTMAVPSCSSALKQGDHALHRIFLQNLKVRRPVQAAADPGADLGDYQYESHPRPDKRLDCVSYLSVLNMTQTRFSNLRRCWASLPPSKGPNGKAQDSKAKTPEPVEPIFVTYRLKRTNQPVLELKEPETAPECMRAELREIPVPREIFFQSDSEMAPNMDNGRIFRCYNSRIQLASDDSFGLKNWLTKFEVTIQFPLKDVPKNDEQTLALLTTWGLAPFWNPEVNGVLGKIVSNDLCGACMGGREKLLHDGLINPPTWPPTRPPTWPPTLLPASL